MSDQPCLRCPTVVCGRKFCRDCGRWRHVLYFRPFKKKVRGEIRVYLNSNCDGCHNRAVKRAAKQLSGDDRLRHQEYWRRRAEGHRRRAGVRPRTADQDGAVQYLDAKAVATYLDRYIVAVETSETNVSVVEEDRGPWADEEVSQSTFVIAYRLNGLALTFAETHQLARWRRGETKRASHADVDRWATKFDLPLWELEEVGAVAA